jgi:hypothetical protein
MGKEGGGDSGVSVPFLLVALFIYKKQKHQEERIAVNRRKKKRWGKGMHV